MRFAAIALALLLTPSALAQSAIAITAELVRAIEDAQTPIYDMPVSGYCRYYRTERIEGRDYVVGEYHWRSGGQCGGPGVRHLFDNAYVTDTPLPEIMDGGCGIVHVQYDIAAKKLSRGCNGIG